MLMTQGSGASEVTQDYVPIPRAGYQSSIPDTYVNVADAVEPATDTSMIDDFSDDDGELPDPVF